MSKTIRRYKKRNVFFTKNKKLLVSLICMVLIVTTTVLGTIAYQTATTTEIINEFETPQIETEIIEEFDGEYKDDVTVTNLTDSDVDVYVRLKFVVSTMEAVYDSEGDPILVDENGTYVYTDINEDGTFSQLYSDEAETTQVVSTSYTGLCYLTGDIVATPSSFDEYGYLANHTTTIINVFDVAGLNTEDWMLDPIGDGVYYYKYSLAPGESAYDLVSSIYQTVYYDGVIVVLTIISDSVQVEGIDVWTDVTKSGYLDVNGNPIIYLTGADNATSAPTGDADYKQRFADNYSSTSGKYSDGDDLVSSTIND